MTDEGNQLHSGLRASAAPGAPSHTHLVQTVHDLLRPALSPLEFAREQEKSNRDKNESRSGRDNHDKARDEKDSAYNTDQYLAWKRMQFIQPQKVAHLSN